jgi:hypothetical protein
MALKIKFSKHLCVVDYFSEGSPRAAKYETSPTTAMFSGGFRQIVDCAQLFQFDFI